MFGRYIPFFTGRNAFVAMGCFRWGGSTYTDAGKASNGAEKVAARCAYLNAECVATDASVVS